VFAANASAGQLAVPPAQVSAMSQVPTDARHVVPALANTSVGHVSLVPLHTSWTSQELAAAARHTVPLLFLASVGQVAALPVQVSALSQVPAAERQVVPEAKTSVGHDAAVPLHVSATSQVPAEARQVVPIGDSESAGQLPPEPVQYSAGSQVPVDARHCTVLAFGTQLPLTNVSQSPQLGHDASIVST
jgi:hypothetical protein